MNRLLAVILAVLAMAAAPAARAAQQTPANPKNPAAPTVPGAPGASSATDQNGHQMQTLGKVGDRDYRWANGWAWMSLGDDAKVSMVVGIEQGIVLSVRENWDAVPKNDQPTLVSTAERLTVGGVSFNQVVLDVDQLYLDADNDYIPVVDAYLYVVLQEKKTPEDKLKKFLEGLRKTYPPPPIEMKPAGKP